MEPKFSVLMSVYAKDRPAWVREALDSVLSNTVKPAEVVIMVDGPVSAELQAVLDDAAQNKTVRIFSHPVPMLRAAALAFAIKQCQYDLIALSGTDSISLPDRFSKQLAYFTSHPEVAVLGGWGQEIDNNTLLPTAVRDVPTTQAEIQSFLKSKSPFICWSVMFKKQAILAAGNYQAFPNLEDEYLWVRLIGKGYQVANLSDVLINIHSVKEHKKMVLALPYFKMKKKLFTTMRQTGLISGFTYYRLVCTAFVKYLVLPNWLCSMFQCEG